MPYTKDHQPNSDPIKIEGTTNTAGHVNEKAILEGNGLGNQLGESLERLLDLILSGLFIVPVSCAIGLIFLVYKIFNRGVGPFFYKDERLGKDKKPFQMYKIRTLKMSAKSQFSQKVLTPGSGMELKCGKFLRSTRLDELPQIFNILKGEMRFVGPRPLRLSLYEENCQFISGYDLRFRVKPGLLGYSQIFTPHTTPKRIRSSIDNRFVTRKHRFLFDIVFIFWAVAVLTYNLIRESIFSLKEYYHIASHRGGGKDLRNLRRISGEGINFSFNTPDFVSTLPHRATVISLNNNAVAITTDIDLDPNKQLYGTLEVWTPKGKIKRVQCKAFIYKKRPYDNDRDLAWFYVLFFTPISALNKYVLEQYILKQSISKYVARDYRVSQSPRDQSRVNRILSYGIKGSGFGPAE